jgi:hypothetical protein
VKDDRSDFATPCRMTALSLHSKSKSPNPRPQAKRGRSSPWDPTVALCLGANGDPTGSGGSYERGTRVTLQHQSTGKAGSLKQRIKYVPHFNPQPVLFDQAV